MVEESHLSARRTLAKLCIPALCSIGNMIVTCNVVRPDCSVRQCLIFLGGSSANCVPSIGGIIELIGYLRSPLNLLGSEEF